MSAPPSPYNRLYNFNTFQTSNPTTPLPGLQVDAELNAIKAMADSLIARLAEIQRSDGALGNGIVTLDSLAPDVLAAASGYVRKGAWVTATVYAVNDMVTVSNASYVALIAHTSGTFATDLAAHKWALVSLPGIAADGSTTVTADIPFSAHKLTGVANGVGAQDAVTVSQAGGLATTAANAAIAAIPAAGESTSGLIQLSTDVEALAGSDDTTAMTPHDVRIANVDSFSVVIFNEITAVSAGAGKRVIRMPYAFTVTEVRAYNKTAQTSGLIQTVDINESGVSILSTKLTIDNTEKTSVTAVDPAVISDTALANDAEISFDVDQIGDGTAVGLTVVFIGYRT